MCAFARLTPASAPGLYAVQVARGMRCSVAAPKPATGACASLLAATSASIAVINRLTSNADASRCADTPAAARDAARALTLSLTAAFASATLLAGSGEDRPKASLCGGQNG
jgi:hypothetical protein